MTTDTAHQTVPGHYSGSAPTHWDLAQVRHGKTVTRITTSRAIVGRNRSRTDPTAGRFTRRDVARIVDDAYNLFDRKVPELPSEPTAGSRQNVGMAAFTLALCEAFEKAGIEREYAIELTGDITWRFYRRWGRITKAATELITRDPTRRLRVRLNTLMTYPFGPPGYVFEEVPEEHGGAINILRCPVADYFGGHGAADLCAASWCNLDYALAEMWGARLQRSGTLVGGAECCDFRFRTLEAEGESS